jgi:NAD kinase
MSEALKPWGEGVGNPVDRKTSRAQRRFKRCGKKHVSFMCGVYGVLSSIEGCNTFQDILQHISIEPWYNSMKDTIQRHGGSSVMNK